MRRFITFTLLLGLFFSCSRDKTVQISGRIENGDSIASIWVNDSIYTFSLDDNDFFSGEVVLEQAGFVTLLHNSLNLFLAPGEDLEIYLNALNFSGSLYFRGSLGGINSYLKEQEVAVFFNKDYYALNESAFVEKMKELIDEKIKLLEAKNFDDSFTSLEKERIRYSIAGKVSYYPISQKRMFPEKNYQAGPLFTNFLSSFSLNNEDLFGTKDYRSFLLDYIYFQGNCNHGKNRDCSNDIADFVLSSITNSAIKNFLLTEIVYRYIWENNGLDGADYLLSVFRKECSDKNKIAYMEEVISNWEKLLPGKPAPDFSVVGRDGNMYSLKDFKESYLYITVWATWCVPCKSELPYLNVLQEEYRGKNIKFISIVIDKYHESRRFMGENMDEFTFIDVANEFNENYMIISVPRFVLIGPQGDIINSNAPRPSGQIKQLLDTLVI